jgi:hypothetical protein
MPAATHPTTQCYIQKHFNPERTLYSHRKTGSTVQEIQIFAVENIQDCAALGRDTMRLH